MNLRPTNKAAFQMEGSASQATNIGIATVPRYSRQTPSHSKSFGLNAGNTPTFPVADAYATEQRQCLETDYLREAATLRICVSLVSGGRLYLVHGYRVLPEILTGKKRICLAITEPSVGSDVRNITATAEKTTDGKHYIVNGEKKISHLNPSLRTGGEGAGGLSMLLIPRIEGIRTRKIEIGPGGLSATTYVMFEDAKVPVEYLVGKEGHGFKYTMSNFNHERLWICFQALRGARICFQDAMAWCQKREAFGKTLIEQPVVRHKFGHMARQIDGLQAWIESTVYELEHLSAEKAGELLGGQTALMKSQSGIVAKYIAEECQKLMGGLGLTKTGQGARIENFARGIPGIIVPGGSEDVMLDLGVREAIKISAKANKAKANL